MPKIGFSIIKQLINWQWMLLYMLITKQKMKKLKDLEKKYLYRFKT